MAYFPGGEKGQGEEVDRILLLGQVIYTRFELSPCAPRWCASSMGEESGRCVF
ncbi:hypothetical protein GGTG_14343 [Gaeumannomyces tritici R3-111a-1]|uniref:Uncharacterized protein n=1 Tax=Gaeumannomyces tritici (strain R3-111a-1) TaxID=644352 RepID=J3PL91_GAET3|nr:hypothetical protein GGTG_14343 [Gaeumannomyces tritici R3-111a-1]EJT68078.1 hypothetical protein GGTG_14343 [Gaeumannomyces tritici R3-111a-1]